MTGPGTLRFRKPLYAIANLCFVLLVGAGAATGNNSNPRALYVCLLFALCSSPILLLAPLNGSYAILAVFFTLYFVYFGVLDVTGLFTPTGNASFGVLSMGELAILVGGLLLLAGYHIAVKFVQRRRTGVAKDWSPTAVLVIGLILWAGGTAGAWYWEVHVVVRRSVEINNQLGGVSTAGILILKTIQPLGILVLAYSLAAFRKKYMLPIIIVVVAMQVVLGFVSDSKEMAMHAALLVIVTLFFVQGRVPKAWLAGSVVVIALAFPIFQAYRIAVTDVRKMTNAQAAQDLGRVFDIAREYSEKMAQGYGGSSYKTQSFFERSWLKGNMELILARVGNDVEYQDGDTLLDIFSAFIPRLIWHDKHIDVVGQLFNQEFHISIYRDVYISPSHIGELYWNFGWKGILLGMPLIGWLLGYINARCDLSQKTTVTRLLIIATTIYLLCVRFEGTIAVQYVQWLRSMLAIFVMHLLLARVRVKDVRARPDDRNARRSPGVPTLTAEVREAVR